MPNWPEARSRKFRQAAFVYLHVAILYEAAVWTMMRQGMAPTRFGPPVLWLVLGAVVGLGVAAALYWWQNVWLARVVWLVHGGRLPWVINGAFFAEAARLPPGFYLTALVVIVANLWMLARAGWDL